MGFFLSFSDLWAKLGVLISDITPIWTVIVAKTHSDMRSDGSSYRISYRNLAGMLVRDFLRYEIRYEFISDPISVFLVCSGNRQGVRPLCH
jgi:hypothetical protein